MKNLRRYINSPRGTFVAFGVVALLFGVLQLIFVGYSTFGAVLIVLLAAWAIIPSLTLSERGFEKYQKIASRFSF